MENVPLICRGLLSHHQQILFIRSLSSSWSTVESKMRQLVQAKRYSEAVQLYKDQSHSCSKIGLNLVLKALIQLKDYHNGIRIHEALSKKFLEDPFIQTSLIHLYMQYGDVDRAEKVFVHIKQKTIYMYGAMFKGYLSNHKPEKVLNLFDQMTLTSDPVIIITVLNACGKLANEDAIRRGTDLLQRLPQHYFQNEKLTTAAIDMLMKFHRVQHAETLFRSMTKKTIVTYGAMMQGYVENNLPERAIDVYETLPLQANDHVRSIVLTACAGVPNGKGVQLGKKFFDQIPKQSLNNTVVLNSAMQMFMKFGDVNYAKGLFQSLEKKDSDTYAIMINGCLMNHLHEGALDLFETMPFKPNEIVCTIVFNVCGALLNGRAIQIGKRLLNDVPGVSFQDLPMVNAAINMLMKFGHVTEAESLFQSVKNKRCDTYGVIINGFILNDQPEKALNLFSTIPFKLNDYLYAIAFNGCASLANEWAVQLGNKLLDQIPTAFLENPNVFNAAIDMLIRFDNFHKAKALCSARNKTDLTTLCAMIKIYAANDQPRQVWKVVQQIIRENLALDDSATIKLIDACGKIGLISICKMVFNYVPFEFHQNLAVISALINMWGKSGGLDQAKELFQSVSEPNTVVYNNMIQAYARNGMGMEAVQLYWQMPESLRDGVSDTCVLNACSHAGLIKEAEKIFNNTKAKTSNSVTVMIDCYSRMHMFDRAEQLLNEYETSNPPSLIMYMTMISGARNHHRSDLAQKLYDQMKILFPKEKNHLISASILLSNTYASIGDYQQAQNVRIDRLKALGNKVKPGLSWTEVNGEIVEFQAHDRRHPRSKEIYEELSRLSNELKEFGHRYDSTWVIREMHEGESVESVLCGHSEKLAVAFNFIQQSKPTFIQISNSLRICGDCHNAMKLIAQIRQCDIVVRDASRTHHFYTNGQCSCQDHF